MQDMEYGPLHQILAEGQCCNGRRIRLQQNKRWDRWIGDASTMLDIFQSM